ncbi:MAG: transcriptional regulator, partial [Mitsuokella sp.]
LLQYAWPGNIRELQNAVEYLHSVCGHRCPELADLPPNLQRRSAVHAASPLPARPLGERIRDEIRRANAAGETIGRRSLAARLSAPESRIRAELKALEKEGAIRLTRGRGGIRMNAT